jgi:hypothetical protein
MRQASKRIPACGSANIPDCLFSAYCGLARAGLPARCGSSLQAHVARIMKAYPRLVDTVKGRSGSDPFVIALAASTNPTMTVVTEEFVGKVRIPDVCNADKIQQSSLTQSAHSVRQVLTAYNRALAQALGHAEIRVGVQTCSPMALSSAAS